MADVFSDDYWEHEFDITRDDLERILKRMRDERRAFTLTELTERLVHGRLEHGEDSGPSVLPDWVISANVLSWNEEAQWCVGCRVLVARQEDKKMRAYLGVITEADVNTFWIKLDENGVIVKYERVVPGNPQALQRYEYILNAIKEQEQSARREQLATNLNEQVEVRMLKSGSKVASRLLDILQRDTRFISLEDRWFRQDLLYSISVGPLKKLQMIMLSQDGSFPTLSLISFIDSPLSQDDVGLFSLYNAILKFGEKLFINEGTTTHPLWKAVKPPPPPWDQATVQKYAYDPDNYRILVEPGQRLTKQLAERLQELGLYADVVTTADE